MIERDVARLVIVRNPASRHAGRVHSMIGNLLDAFPDSELAVLSSQKRFSDHKDMLANKLRIGDVVLPASGDAIAGATLCALADRKLRAVLGRIPIGLLPCGQENDLYNVFSGGNFRRPSDVITRSQTMALRPVGCAIETSGEYPSTRVFRAAGYIGTNATAIGADFINSQLRDSRAPKLVRHARTGLHTLRRTKPVPIRSSLNGGHLERVREMVVPNIRVMGGLAPFPHVRPHDEGLHAYSLDESTPLLTGIRQLLTGELTHRQSFNGTLSFRPDEDVLMQFDGDTIQDDVEARAPAGSTVTISRFALEDACFPLVAWQPGYSGDDWPRPYVN